MLDRPTLTGRHVRLEPLGLDHVDELWPAAADPATWRYMTFDVQTPGDLAEWVRRRLDSAATGRAVPFLVRDAVTGDAIGSTSLFDIDLVHRRMEIGHTWLGPPHRRTGVNTEAKRLLLAHAFDTLGANRVQFKTDARNVVSRRAILRLGATEEGILRQHDVLPDGHVRDAVVFSVVRSEWPAVRARLDALMEHAATS